MIVTAALRKHGDFDLNKDGFISDDEFKGALGQGAGMGDARKPMSMIGSLDTDQDGKTFLTTCRQSWQTKIQFRRKIR